MRAIATAVVLACLLIGASTAVVSADPTKPTSGSVLRIALIACHKLAGEGQLLCYEPRLDKKTVLESRGSAGIDVAFFDFSAKRLSIVPVATVTAKDLSIDDASPSAAPQGSWPPITFNGRWLRVVIAACNQLALGGQMICEEPATDKYTINVTSRLFEYDVAFDSPKNSLHVSLSRAEFSPSNLTALGPTVKTP